MGGCSLDYSQPVQAVISILLPELSTKQLKEMKEENCQSAVKPPLTLCALAILIISGLDHRHQWSTVPMVIVIVSALIMTGAFVFLSIIMKENSFATRIVEIQEEQKIIDAGTYSIVRHPMYLAFTVIFLISPLVLGSLVALIPALCFPYLIAFRIHGEEEVRKRFRGYDDYVKKVKYRLIPFIW